MPIISAKDLSFKYESLKNPTLHNIDLAIEEGEKVLIAGPSGCGKSTLAHLINGLIPYTYKGDISGELTVDGIHPYDLTIYDVSEHVGTILQDQDAQFVALTVAEDVAFVYENNVTPVPEMREGVEKTLKWMGMEEFKTSTPQNLSGGQRQKVGMAGVLASRTPILLFDEPLANLDPMSGYHAMQTINYIHDETDKTVIVIEHRIEDVIEHGFDRIIVMKEGRIVGNDTPDNILASGILDECGLREPLYIEAIKNCGADISHAKGLSEVKNCLPFKDCVIQSYENTAVPVPPPNDDVILSVRGMNYRYFEDSPLVLKDLSFDIKKGEFLAVLGNNGAGKSTILKLLTGFLKNMEGAISYRGRDITGDSIRERAKVIGYVMQNPNHMITQNLVKEEVGFGLLNNGMPEGEAEQSVNDILKVCGLYGYRNWPISNLSYGQKKRVTIASILALGPEIIVLDEPTAGQDQANYVRFMTFLERVKAQGTTVMMITHDMQLSLEYAERGIVLNDGKIIADKNIFEIFADEDVLHAANLKHTSITALADLYGIEHKDTFMAYFVQRLKEVGTIE